MNDDTLPDIYDLVHFLKTHYSDLALAEQCSGWQPEVLANGYLSVLEQLGTATIPADYSRSKELITFNRKLEVVS